MATFRIPPGRAGRLWLRERLALAESALSLLERKRALLESRQRDLRARREETGRDWAAACASARIWQGRALLLGGARSVSAATPVQPAEISIRTAVVAGVKYPDVVEYLPPERESAPIIGSATLWHTAQAHRAALAAAARHAAADGAVRAVERELTATRIRAQALRRRRIPALLAALTELELILEERERSERIPLHRDDWP